MLGCIALTGLCAGTARAQLPDYRGRPVVELIEALRERGIRIVYSAELLPARLGVAEMPASDDELEGLREILAAHGLGIEIGPRDTWIVVSQVPGTAARAAARTGIRPAAPPSIETVVVTASRYPIDRSATISSSTFQRHALETTPALGQDPLRVTHRLPGVTSDQLTSRMHIRGGTLDEVLVTLDGIELISPYHLKDFQNVFSSVNPRIVESMDVRTGGYEARFGDHMSGIVEIESIDPTEFRHYEIGVSLLETSVLSSGLFGDGRGSWVTSLRRGNLDVLSSAGDSGIGTPQYVDFFNKLGFTLTPRLELETGLLSLDDNISLTDGSEASAAANYDDLYSWATLRQSGASGLESSYRISFARLDRTRSGVIDDPDRVTGTLAENSKFDQLTLAADWSVRPMEGVRVEWGIGFSSADVDHRAATTRTNVVPVLPAAPAIPAAPPANAAVRLGQSKRSLYASVRYRIAPRLVAELGIRADEQSLTGERQTDPRLGLLFDITDRTSLRAAWGRYSQSDSLGRLAVADGIVLPQPSRESRHFILGLEHMFGETGLFRVEIYEKRASGLEVRFENLFERVSLLPELLPDRSAIEPGSADARGIELSIEGGTSTFGWWANAALARTRERFPSGTFRRGWDERRSIKAGGEWSSDRWTVTAGLGHRSGWPISKLTLEDEVLVVSGYNAVRLPDFASVDVRASRNVDVAVGALSWSIEVSNLLDHENDCCLDYRIATGSGMPDMLIQEYDELLGIVPNIGLRWEF